MSEDNLEILENYVHLLQLIGVEVAHHVFDTDQWLTSYTCTGVLSSWQPDRRVENEKWKKGWLPRNPVDPPIGNR